MSLSLAMNTHNFQSIGIAAAPLINPQLILDYRLMSVRKTESRIPTNFLHP